MREPYLAQPTLPAKDLIDAAAWEKSAGAEIDQTTDSCEADARAGGQANPMCICAMCICRPCQFAGEGLNSGESLDRIVLLPSRMSFLERAFA